MIYLLVWFPDNSLDLAPLVNCLQPNLLLFYFLALFLVSQYNLLSPSLSLTVLILLLPRVLVDSIPKYYIDITVHLQLV